MCLIRLLALVGVAVCFVFCWRAVFGVRCCGAFCRVWGFVCWFMLVLIDCCGLMVVELAVACVVLRFDCVWLWVVGLVVVGFGRDFLFLVLIVSGWVVCFDLLLLYVGFQGWACLRAVFVCLRFIIVLVVVLFACCGG